MFELRGDITKGNMTCRIFSFRWFLDVRIFICRRFGTLFHLHRCLQHLWRWNWQCSETSAYKNSDAWVSPKRKNTIFRPRRKFEIKNEILHKFNHTNAGYIECCSSNDHVEACSWTKIFGCWSGKDHVQQSPTIMRQYCSD